MLVFLIMLAVQSLIIWRYWTWMTRQPSDYFAAGLLFWALVVLTLAFDVILAVLRYWVGLRLARATGWSVIGSIVVLVVCVLMLRVIR